MVIVFLMRVLSVEVNARTAVTVFVNDHSEQITLGNVALWDSARECMDYVLSSPEL